MVAEFHDDGGASHRFVLSPNSSLSNRAMLAVYGGICAVGVAIGITFAALGLWLVLPFAGVELAALGAALYVCVLRAEAGRRRGEGRREFPAHGQGIEVGGFLTDRERTQLVSDLARAFADR